MRADLHTHASPASGDSRMTIAELAAAAAAHGLDAVALTDHGPGSDFAHAERAFDERGVALIPGREVSCALGHVLVLATDRDWLASLPPRVALPLTERPAGPLALVWAHPAGWRVAGFSIEPRPDRGAEHVHAVEVLNGERLYQDGGVERATAIAAELGVPGTGGSDAHDPGGVGRCLTEARGATDALSFIEAVVAGEVRPVLSEGWAMANDMTYRRADLAGYVG